MSIVLILGALVVACLVYGLEQVIVMSTFLVGVTALSTMNPYAWITLIFLALLLRFIYR